MEVEIRELYRARFFILRLRKTMAPTAPIREIPRCGLKTIHATEIVMRVITRDSRRKTLAAPPPTRLPRKGIT